MKKLGLILMSTLSFIVANLALPALAHQHQSPPPQSAADPIVAVPTMAADLGFANEIHAHVYWVSGPVEGAESLMRIEFSQGVDQTPIELQASVVVLLWMPDMGHGSAPTAVARATDENGIVKTGVYNVANIYFVMGGVWDVRITLNNDDGSSETQTFGVELGGSGSGMGGMHH